MRRNATRISSSTSVACRSVPTFLFRSRSSTMWPLDHRLVGLIPTPTPPLACTASARRPPASRSPSAYVQRHLSPPVYVHAATAASGEDDERRSFGLDGHLISSSGSPFWLIGGRRGGIGRNGISIGTGGS
jgi:hypothetical protein